DLRRVVRRVDRRQVCVALSVALRDAGARVDSPAGAAAAAASPDLPESSAALRPAVSRGDAVAAASGDSRGDSRRACAAPPGETGNRYVLRRTALAVADGVAGETGRGCQPRGRLCVHGCAGA